MNFKSIIIVLVTLLVFTQGLIVFHNSSYEKGEYDRICNAIYDEKVWIDTCYLPYNTEIKTYETFRNIEVLGIAIFTLLYIKKFYIKH